jgi:sugar-specific transcriptional regulator TrmB
MNHIIDYLERLDLSEVEAKLYFTLLKSGPLSVRELAKAVEIKRTTTYMHIDQLIEKGLIIKLVKKSRKLVSANDPKESLKALAEQKLESAKKTKEQFPEMLKRISNIALENKDISEAEIRYYKGVSSLKKIYKEALDGEELCLYATLSELRILFHDPNLFENALKRNPKLKIYEIYGDSPRNIKKFSFTTSIKRYRYKFMPESVGLTAPGILLFDNKVAIINTKGSPSAVVLRNSDYYVNSKKLFDFIWKLLPETEKNKV